MKLKNKTFLSCAGLLLVMGEVAACKSASFPPSSNVSSPLIVSQPSGITVTAGQIATFTVKATGAVPLRYQWKRNGVDIPEANSPTYTAPATTVADHGATFRVLISNSVGAVSSREAILEVNAAANSYSTSFLRTEDPISEGGKWIGGQSAGANLWGDVQTNGTMAYGVSEPTEFGDPTAILTGRWSSSQKASATVKVNIAPTERCCHEVEIRLRTVVSSRSITGYEAYCSVMPTRQYCHIARWNGPNGGYCNIEGSSPETYLVSGDVLSATVSGTNPVVITGFKNGTKIMQAIDTGSGCKTGGPAGPFTSGNPGIGFYDSSDNHWSYFGFSNFTASDGLN